MALVRIPDQDRTLYDAEAIRRHMSSIGIIYERWEAAHAVAPAASAEEILAAYAHEVEKLKARGGYLIADVINVNRQTPGLEEMLAKFNREHWHDEDEVRFIIHGRGVFHIHPAQGPVTSIEVEAGDLICVPRGTLHWFDLCPDLEIRAIRLFQDAAGWVPHYTDRLVEQKYRPAGRARPPQEPAAG